MGALIVLVLLVVAIFHWPLLGVVLLVLWCLGSEQERRRKGCFTFLPTPPSPVIPSVSPPPPEGQRAVPEGREHFALAERLLTASLTGWREKMDALLEAPAAVRDGIGTMGYEEYVADAGRQLQCWCTLLALRFADLGKAWEWKDQTKIREACAGIDFGCQQLYEWTLKMLSLEPPVWTRAQHARQVRMADEVLRQVEQTVGVLRDSLYDPNCRGTVTLNANFCPPYDPQCL